MSDYKREKVIRLPFPVSLLEKFNTEDPYDCEKYLKEKLGDLWKNNDINSFQMGYSDKAMYIDWCYYSTYGEELGDFGNSRLLTQKELDIIKPYFDKLEIEYKDEDLRLVDYCYYNCCEPSDYYELSGDDSSLFIT